MPDKTSPSSLKILSSILSEMELDKFCILETRWTARSFTTHCDPGQEQLNNCTPDGDPRQKQLHNYTTPHYPGHQLYN
jgi:hypothetical protein